MLPPFSISVGFPFVSRFNWPGSRKVQTLDKHWRLRPWICTMQLIGSSAQPLANLCAALWSWWPRRLKNNDRHGSWAMLGRRQFSGLSPAFGNMPHSVMQPSLHTGCARMPITNTNWRTRECDCARFCFNVLSAWNTFDFAAFISEFSWHRSHRSHKSNRSKILQLGRFGFPTWRCKPHPLKLYPSRNVEIWHGWYMLIRWGKAIHWRFLHVPAMQTSCHIVPRASLSGS